MGCSGCSNNGPTPIVGNLDDGAIPMQYIGDRSAAVTFFANGQDYLAGNDRIHDYLRVRPGDVPVLEATGQFRRAPEWMPTITIVLPTRGRPAELARCFESLVATAPSVQVVVVMDEGDDETQAVFNSFVKRLPLRPLVVAAGRTAAQKWNDGLLVVETNTVVFAADDLVFHPEWIEKATKALRAFPDGSALVGFDELANSEHPLHFAVTRKLLDEVNGGLLVVPHYVSWYMDTELCDKARRWGRYMKNCGAIVEHRHPMHGNAPIDDLHRVGFLANQHRDRWVYETRKRAEFPTDWATGAAARNWLAGYVPPVVDRTEEVLTERLAVTEPAQKKVAKKTAKRQAVPA